MNIYHMSFTAGILIIVIVLLRRFTMNKLPKNMFLILWGVVMVRLLVPVSYSMKIPSMFRSHFENPCRVFEKHVVGQAGTIANPLASSHGTSMLWNQKNLYLAWIIGIVILVGIAVIRYRKEFRNLQESLPYNGENLLFMRMKLFMGVKSEVTLRSSELVATPITYGVMQPSIVFPKQVEERNSTRQLQYMMIHELVHIKRRDILWKMISLAALCIHWFNPLVWLMYYLFNRDLEIACDERVLSMIGEEEKEDYAMTLIQMAEKKSRTEALCCGFGKDLIEERIVSIMKHKKVTMIGTICACVIVAGSFTIFANINKAEEKKADTQVEEVTATPYVVAKTYEASEEEAAADISIEADDVCLTWNSDDPQASGGDEKMSICTTKDGAVGKIYIVNTNGSTDEADCTLEVTEMPEQTEEVSASTSEEVNAASTDATLEADK